MDHEQILEWLRETRVEHLEELWQRADSVRRQTVGDEVHLRGLTEFSNICRRNCEYCGLRAANRQIEHYRMTIEQILDCAREAHARGYGTIVLQSGEFDLASGEWIGVIIRAIRSRFSLAITLSVGERRREAYAFWRSCGADRYLLRFETSDAKLYRRLHPPGPDHHQDRIGHLRILAGLGYEVGSGIIVGLPGQTWDSVANDLVLFRDLDLDMIGIGPYIPSPDTPLGRRFREGDSTTPDQVPNTEIAARKVLALSRILCPEANIPATTAAATTDAGSYESALRAGANVIMPDVTPLRWRRRYEIYPSPVRESDDGHERALQAIASTRRRIGAGRGDRARQLSA